jgi:hypothetical protein
MHAKKKGGLSPSSKPCGWFGGDPSSDYAAGNAIAVLTLTLDAPLADASTARRLLHQ